MKETAADKAERLKKHWAGPMTEAQIAFLEDVKGFIDFAVRNGLNFPMVMSEIIHDVNEIARDGFDYEKTRSRGFRPKVSGYSKLSPEDLGEADDSPE